MPAAAAAKKYRQRRQRIGYAALQIWVPTRFRAEMLDMIHEEVERRLALEDAEQEGLLADRRDEDRAPRPKRRAEA